MMRWMVAAALGIALGYMEVGAVVTLGCIITLLIASLSKDIDKQGLQLTEAFRGHSELQTDESEKGFAELRSGMEGLRRELLVVAKALTATNRRLDEVGAPLVQVERPRGPREA